MILALMPLMAFLLPHSSAAFSAPARSTNVTNAQFLAYNVLTLEICPY